MGKYGALLQYALRRRGFLALVFVLSVALAALEAAQPWPLKWVVDHVLSQRPMPAALQVFSRWTGFATEPASTLLLFVGIGLALFALKAGAEYLHVRAWTVTGRRMVYDLCETVFAHLLRRSWVWQNRQPLGDRMARATDDCWALYRAVDALCFAPGQAVLTCGVMLWLMSRLDGRLTLFVAAMLPFMLAASCVVGRPLKTTARLGREIESRLQSHLHQTLAGQAVVQAFAQEPRQTARFETYAAAALRTQQRLLRLGAINSLGTGLVTALAFGGVLWLGAQQVQGGRLTLGGLTVFLTYLGLLQTQMKSLAQTYTAYQQFTAGADRVLEVLEAREEVPETGRTRQLRLGSADALCFEQIHFGYRPDQPVLAGLDLECRSGEIVAIVGASGSGKSTLLRLVPRFADPWQGQVRLGEHDVREYWLHELRAHIGWMAQEPELLPGTIAENIGLGRPGADRTAIEAAARAACAHDFIQTLPRGYETEVGERGVALSAGQAQRIALARAWLRDAPIWLLDEPTRALDATTEQQVLAELDRLRGKRLVLVAAHRPATVMWADRVAVLEEGLVIETGRPEELRRRSRRFARLLHTMPADVPWPSGRAGEEQTS